MLPACIFGKHFFVYAKGLPMALFPLLFIIFGNDIGVDLFKGK